MGRVVGNGRCQKKGCLEATTGGKPYCALHLAEMPYVAHLHDLLQEQADDDEDDEPVSLEGPTVHDLRQLLGTGPKTLDALAVRMNVTREVIARYVQAMEAAGMVTCQRHSWRTEVISLKGQT